MARWLAGGYTNASASVSARASSAHIDSAYVAGYGGTDFGAFNFRFGAALAWHTIGTSRSIVFPGFSEQASARYSAMSGQVFGEVGYGMSFGNMAFEPFAGLAWVYVNTESFNETGGLSAAGASSTQNDVNYSTLGARWASTYLMANGMTLTPRASLAWQHTLGTATPTAALTLQSTGTPFGILGIPIARDAALVEAGGDLHWAANQGRRRLFRPGRQQRARSFGQGQFLLAVLKKLRLKNSMGSVMLGTRGLDRDGSRSAAWKRRGCWGRSPDRCIAVPLSMAVSELAWGQVAATLPRSPAVAPRHAPSPPRRQAPAARRAAVSPPVARATTPVPSALPAYQVIATTPVTGIGFDRNKVPAMAQTVTAEDFSRVYSPNVLDTLQQRISGVITTDIQGNGFLPGPALSRLRGLAAARHPAGACRLHAGVPDQRAFGDTVNWDLIPTVAIGRADIWTNNPAFGLNALGGAVSLQMKDGFNYNGFEFDASGGSYGRVGGSMQYGVRSGEWGLYLAAEGFKDTDGATSRRRGSRRFYGDLGWRGTDAEVHFITSIADNYFGVVGPTPIWIFSITIIARSRLGRRPRRTGAAHRDERPLLRERPLDGAEQSLCRKFQQAHVDGNDADVERCSGQAANPLFNTLCLENDSFPTQPAANFQILDQNNRPINCPPGPGNTCATTPWGTVDRTWTNAITTGASLQGINDDKLLGHDNYFTIGGSVDRSKIGFQGNSELGYIYPDFFVGPNAAVPGTGKDIVHTAGQHRLCAGQPRCLEYLLRHLCQRHLRYHQSAVGDCGRTLQHRADRDDRSAWQQPRSQRAVHVRTIHAGGRFHLPRFLPELMTFYAGYSEANRAPTPLELGCSNPLRPCLLEGFLVSTLR